MRYYDYPPSQYIRKYEPFEANSHFYVKGNCKFEGTEYYCEFEVVYTLSGIIYMVAYLDTDDLIRIFCDTSIDGTSLSGTPKEERIVADFYGKDLRNGFKVYVRKAISVTNGLMMLSDPPVFICDSFTLLYHDSLPQHYSLEQNTVNFDILNIFYPFTAKINYLIDFDIGDSKTVSLQLVNKPEKNEDGFKNSILSVPRNSIPVGWRAEDVADLWCALVSFAIGKDVRWIIKRNNYKRRTIFKFNQRNNIARNISTYGVLTTHYDFWSQLQVKRLITDAFTSVRQNRVSRSASILYSEIMWHFIEYRLITNRVQDQARLITTVVEELLTHWEEHTGEKPSSIITQDEAKLLWSGLSEKWIPNIEDMLGKSISKQKRDAIKNRLKTAFTEEIVRPGFEKRLRHMLAMGQNDDTWRKEHVEKRLGSFVKTRNKIAHEGRFPSENSVELFDYYYNMLMILPLLIFSIYGYTGVYVDLSSEYRDFYARKKAIATKSASE
jgi:hypothetical protein